MNKAFVREADDERASNPLPDRPIPAEPNLVTPEGLAHIQEMVDLAQEQHTAARDAGDANEVARTERDLRYWMARQATAQVMKRNSSSEVVEFGSSVTIRRQDGRNQTFRIVGTDEADPARVGLETAKDRPEPQAPAPFDFGRAPLASGRLFATPR